ncbi:hypothetical protein Nepgr_028642 [Nepenthes gracilis]|uniref:LOB domain-containing protein n=1 Tax=Nepenthes gracilis TaxID=150966 RepID=A0AAD3TCN0_NEPGR|nr:hypothetical protein Nepgr_028642 [Nepenthes gracilis]
MTGISSSCGACRFLRRKCTSECIFAPYFSYDQAVHHFAAVHKVFGASNASRLLLQIPEHYRSEAAGAMSYEALTRMQDPVYGCVGYIYALEQQVTNLQEEIQILGNCLAIGIASSCEGSQLTNNTSDGLLASARPGDMNMQAYVTEQQHIFTHSGNRVNLMFNSNINVLPQDVYEWEEQAL